MLEIPIVSRTEGTNMLEALVGLCTEGAIRLELSVAWKAQTIEVLVTVLRSQNSGKFKQWDQQTKDSNICVATGMTVRCCTDRKRRRSTVGGPAAICFIACDACSDSIAKLFRACFCGYRTTIMRYVAKWGFAQTCLCEAKYQGAVSHRFGEVLTVAGLAVRIDNVLASRCKYPSFPLLPFMQLPCAALFQLPPANTVRDSLEFI